MRRALAVIMVWSWGCGEPEEPHVCAEPAEFCGAIPVEAEPCDERRYWPLTLRSDRQPVQVHYAQHADDEMARAVLDLVEHSWTAQVDGLGFSAPLDDGGACRDADGLYDVFLFRGFEGAYVLGIEDNPDTPHDDWVSYMVVDPWGPYGGAALPATIAHELNHALQASDDLGESPLALEMTATYIEELLYPDNDTYLYTVQDFQRHVDWSVYRNDDWETWYMYGASVYLQMLQARYFANDGSFVAQMWRRSRGPADFVDALDELLAQRGSSFPDSVAELARWRWYTGTRDDGDHLADAAAMAEVPLAADLDASPRTQVILPRPMSFGSAYVRVTRGGGQPSDVRIALDSTAAVTWVVQAVPGPAGADGERLDASSGWVTLDLSEHMSRTLILTAVPSTYDPDDGDDTRHAITLRIE